MQPLRTSGPRPSGRARPQVLDPKAQQEPSVRNAESQCWGHKDLGLAPELSFLPRQWWHLPEADSGAAHTGARGPQAQALLPRGATVGRWVSSQGWALDSWSLLNPLGRFGNKAHQCPQTHPGEDNCHGQWGTPQGHARQPQTQGNLSLSLSLEGRSPSVAH